MKNDEKLSKEKIQTLKSTVRNSMKDMLRYGKMVVSYLEKTLMEIRLG